MGKKKDAKKKLEKVEKAAKAQKKELTKELKEAAKVREQAEREAAGAIEPGATPFSDALRVDTGFRLEEVDPRSTPAFTGNKVQGKRLFTNEGVARV